jgi:hypothetical protein
MLCRYGVGMCIRNEKGKFMKDKLFGGKQLTIPPQEADALLLNEALLALSELGV